ncbi:TPA: ABC transporter ATP-binding protein, partial [Clostridioides difficile]|nr:ABC transporter ATP-binding protein [Clostridioides difficile]
NGIMDRKMDFDEYLESKEIQDQLAKMYGKDK